MKSQARAVVVGGGAVGVSIAYHLAKGGWDVILLERGRVDGRVHMARGGSSAALQHVVCDQPHP